MAQQPDLEADFDAICGAPMFWSHFDAATYMEMIATVGFEVELSRIIRDESCPDGSHLFVLVRR